MMTRIASWCADLKTGAVRWDPSMYRMLGVPPLPSAPAFEQLLARAHADDRTSVVGRFRASLARCGQYEARFRLLRTDGRLLWLHHGWEVVAGDDGHPASVRGVLVDDTRSLELAGERESPPAPLHLSLAAGLLGFSIWSVDLATQRVQADAWALQSLSLVAGPAGVPLSAIRSLVHPEDLPKVLAADRAALDGFGVIDVEVRFRLPDGSYRRHLTRRMARRDAGGRPVAIEGVTLDVTEREAQRRRDEDASMSMRLILEATDVALFGIDASQGSVRWNGTMHELFRAEGEIATNAAARTALLRHVHPDDRERVQATYDHISQASAPGAELEFRLQLPDGSVRWLVGRTRAMVDGNGRRVVGMLLDDTERRAARERLREAEDIRRDKDAADSSSRAKSMFLARVSHELRTPLNAVLGFAQMMQKDTAAPLPPEQAQRLGMIRDAGQHLLALIGDTLDLASIEMDTLPVSLQPVEVRRVVDQAHRWVAPQAERAGVRLEFGRIEAWALADPRRLCQVLVNLLSNGIKYNRRGGRVQLEVRADAPHDRVLVEVTDNGRGMNEAQLARLFAPFERLDAERQGIEGAGIGLSLVHHLVQRMDGAITAESSPGVGTTFRVSLPARAAPARAMAAAAAAVPAPLQPSRQDLLCVDDDPVNQLLLQELVALRPGMRLHTAADGMSAMVIARRTRPALIFLDLQLPDFDGFDVIRRLRSDPQFAQTTIVAMSASLSPRTVERARGAGFAECWEKPIEAKRFLAALDNWLELGESMETGAVLPVRS